VPKSANANKSPEELYQERDQLFADAIALKPVARVPMALRLGYFTAKYAGITTQDAFYDAEKWKKANRDAILDYQPDVYSTSTGTESGEALELLQAKNIKWPGHGVSPYHTHQSIELEPMKENEYEPYFADPSDFTVRTFLPRVYGVMEPFAKLSPLSGSTGLIGYVAQLARPEFAPAYAAIRKAGEATAKWQASMGGFSEEMSKLGYPPVSSLAAMVPFDTVSDGWRGMRGTMMDMYKQPDKLMRLLETMMSRQGDRTAMMARRSKTKRVFMALHRGSDGFMNLKQFEKFYWPHFKKIVLNLVDQGLTPVPFLEGIWDQRLEYLLEFPKGKVLCHFAQTDMFKAKEVLRDHLCIMGNVPSSLLQFGSVSEVEEHCKKLINVCGKGGGYVMTHMPIDEAKPENVRAMVDATRKYGKY
jgi:Uroporphyrinogen decarboxylase (URO-D)